MQPGVAGFLLLRDRQVAGAAAGRQPVGEAVGDDVACRARGQRFGDILYIISHHGVDLGPERDALRKLDKLVCGWDVRAEQS